MKATRALVAALVLAAWAHTASGAPGDLVASFPLEVDSFAAAPHDARVYASLMSANAVAIIDMQQLVVVDTIPVGSGPRGLAPSRDGSLLYVATSGASQLVVVDLQAAQLLPSYPLPTPPGAVAVGHDGRIYVAPNATSFGSLMIVAPLTGQVSQVPCGSVCYRGMLQTTSDGTILFGANQGRTPRTPPSPSASWTPVR
jgi:YVTN family beta-propeller protein